MRWTLFGLAGIVTSVSTLLGCSVITDSSIRAGIGATCATDGDCQGQGATCDKNLTCTLPCATSAKCPTGSSCVASFCRLGGTGALGDACKAASDCASASCNDGLCVSPCATTADCPGSATCAQGACQLTQTTGFVFDNVVSNATQGFAFAHEVGRRDAVAKLPWLRTVSSENNNNDSVSGAIEGLISGGSQVVVVTTNRFQTEAAAKAKAHPEVTFLSFSSPSNGTNFTSYDVRFHQAWYIAGYVASRFEKAGNLGFVGAVPLPEVIRQLNAFTLGALAANPKAHVEVVWANDFVPSDAITKKLVDYLIAGGSRVIVNRLGLGTAVAYVDELKLKGSDIYSVAINNPDACDPVSTSCLGSPYYHWGPLYTRELDAIHRHAFDPKALIDDPIQVDPAVSTFQFALNSKIPGLDGLKPDLVTRVGGLVGPNGEDLTFAGGFCATRANQRPGKPVCEKSGTVVDDQELASMCWLAKGVVQPMDPEDPKSPLVDAPAPDGTVNWPPKSIDPSSLTKPSCM